MEITKKLIQNVKNLKVKPKILFIDGDDARVIEAAIKLKKMNLVEPILLLEKDSQNPINDFETIILDSKSTQFNILVEKYVAKRKGKDTKEQAITALKTRPFYGAMLLEINYVQGAIGGLVYSTSDILRAAFKSIGPFKEGSIISSVMLMHKKEQMYVFSDISVNVKPNDLKLADIGENAFKIAQHFVAKPNVAFLSFSTSQSASTPESQLVERARKIYNKKNPNNLAIGDVQFDAAFDDKVRKFKYKTKSFEGQANVYIFPDLNSGNIGYKIAQHLGGFGAIGPVLVGIAKPMNDLSRGASVNDVFYTSLLTALESQNVKGEK